MAGGIGVVAEGVASELGRRLPGQRKTQRNNLALLVATMLDARSANLMDLAAALPRDAERADMRYQWITRVLGNPLIDPDAVMAPFAREVLRHAAEAGRVVLILDQSKLSDRHQVLMLALRHGERALPLAWRVQATEGPIGFGMQRELLQAVASWMPEGAAVCLMADRFYGTPSLISLCQAQGWGYRLRLKGTLSVRDRLGQAISTAACARSATPYLEDVELTGRRVRTNIGILRDPGHMEPWIVAMSDKPGYLATLDYSQRWGIEPMFSDFKSRGFGIEHTQLRYPDRLARLLLVMALALYSAVSTGSWDEAQHPTHAEKKFRPALRQAAPNASPETSPARRCPCSPAACAASPGSCRPLCPCRRSGTHGNR